MLQFQVTFDEPDFPTWISEIHYELKKTPLDPLNKSWTKKLFQQTELFDAISVLLTDIVTH